MFAEINDLDSLGQINDVKPHLLPPEAFTVLNNIRVDSDGLYVTPGWEVTMVPTGGNRMWAPHFALPIATPSQTFWLYTSLTKAAVFDGVADFDITRASGGNYAANETYQWNGCVLGGIPILNNGIDIPQFWASYSTSQKLQNLTNWTSTLRAKIIRSYGPFLVAFNLTDSGTNFPHLVQWSHPADPGSVPSSWAYNDATKDGGRKDLPDVNSGEIREAMQLGDTMYIYKVSSIWKMKFIGGRYVMDFGSGPWLEGVGIIGPRCVTLIRSGRQHCFASSDDILVHNGNTIDSILLGRQKTTLFNSINREMAHKSFMFTKPDREEVWFCYPELGQDQPNKALVWKYSKGIGAITFVDGIDFRNAVLGDVEGADSETWADGTDAWDVDTGPWNETFHSQIVLCNPVASVLMNLDRGITKNGLTYSPTIIRESLGVLGRDRKGAWITNVQNEKMIDSVWPKATGASFRVRVGFQKSVNDSITWQPYVSFDPTVDRFVNPVSDEDLLYCGALYSVEFSALTGAAWALNGYKIDSRVVGALP